LGLNCDAGVCRHPEVDELRVPVSLTAEMMQAELLSLLRKMDVAQARQIIGTLSSQQRELLRRSLRV
jgi:phycoerythrin-associated linker protein